MATETPPPRCLPGNSAAPALLPPSGLKMSRKRTILGEIQVHALRGVSLEIYRANSSPVMGASGSGKSTLMNILGCLDKPTEAAISSMAKTFRG